MASTETDYERGLRDGKLEALGEAVGRAHVRIDTHERRLAIQERITYALIGAISLIQIAPTLMALARAIQPD